MAHDGCKRSDDFTAARIECPHAAKPQAILLRAVENGKLLFADELVAFRRGKAERIALPLQIQEQLCTVFVLPAARVYLAAPKADDKGQMLDAHWALIFAGAASGALEDSRLTDRCSNNGRFGSSSKLVKVVPHA